MVPITGVSSNPIFFAIPLNPSPTISVPFGKDVIVHTVAPEKELTSMVNPSKVRKPAMGTFPGIASAAPVAPIEAPRSPDPGVTTVKLGTPTKVAVSSVGMITLATGEPKFTDPVMYAADMVAGVKTRKKSARALERIVLRFMHPPQRTELAPVSRFWSTFRYPTILHIVQKKSMVRAIGG